MMRELGAGFQLTEVFSIMVRREGGAEVGRRRRALRWRIGVAILVVVVVAGSLNASAHDVGPISGFTGAPGEPLGDGADCTYPGGCHSMFPVNSGPGALAIESPSNYEPSQTYLIRIDLSQTDQLRWGFMLTVLDAELLQSVGALAPIDANTQVLSGPPLYGDREYIAHEEAGTAAGQVDGNSWSFQWTAPATNVGPVIFYVAGNAANNSESVVGDYIYTTTATVPAPEPGSLAAGLFALSTAAALARRSSARLRP